MTQPQADASQGRELRRVKIAKIYRGIAIALAALAGAVVFLYLYLTLEYSLTLPREPVLNRVIPYNYHGLVVYLTSAEDKLLLVLFYSQFIFGIGAGLFFEGYRKASRPARRAALNEGIDHG